MTQKLQALQADIRNFFLLSAGTKCDPHLDLFEIACLGKPELALQGELLHYLRSNGWLCVQEAGYRTISGNPAKPVSSNIDLLVFDLEAHRNGRFEPICTIELKHYSGNQGGAERPVMALERDCARARLFHNGRRVPIMLIGMYTTIDPVTAQPELATLGLHRFARAVYGPVRATNFHHVFSNWSGVWVSQPSVISQCEGAPVRSCRLQSGEQLTGVVEAAIGIRP